MRVGVGIYNKKKKNQNNNKNSDNNKSYKSYCIFQIAQEYVVNIYIYDVIIGMSTTHYVWTQTGVQIITQPWLAGYVCRGVV